MQKLSREAKKSEAILHMITLGLHPKLIRDFREHDAVRLCSGNDGTISLLEDGSLKEQIRHFEAEGDNLVYLVVRSYTAYGQMDSLLFIDNYSEEWELAREDLKSGYVMTYTLNQDYPSCSEMGSIVVERSPSGGLIRLG